MLRKSATRKTHVPEKSSQNSSAEEIEYSYQKLEVLFSPAERSFLGVLNQAVNENIQIFGKVRVADVIIPKKGMSRSEWQKAFNKISSKHFDFLLCNKKNLAILCAVELDDSSHNKKTRKDRDIFLESVCKSAKLPLVHIAAQSTYNLKEMQNSLAVYLPEDDQSLVSKEQPVEKVEKDQSLDDKKLCPKCSSQMVKRVAKKGKNIGKEFWACSKFPKCKHIEPIKA